MEYSLGLFRVHFLAVWKSMISPRFVSHAQDARQMWYLAVKLDQGGELFWDSSCWSSAWVFVLGAWRTNLN